MWLGVFAVFKGFCYFYSCIRSNDDAKPEPKLVACKIKFLMLLYFIDIE